MTIRQQTYNPNTILYAADVQSTADNGVVEVSAVAELEEVGSEVNLVFCKEDYKVYKRVAEGLGALGDVWKVFSGGGGDFSPANIIANPSLVSGQDGLVQFLVKTTDGTSKNLWVLQGNTGVKPTLTFTEDAPEEVVKKFQAKVSKVKVPADFDGNPVELLPDADREALDGMVSVATTPKAPATYRVELGGGVLPGVMVASGGTGGSSRNTGAYGGGGGAGGVVGFGTHQEIPVGEGVYTISVGSTTPRGGNKANAAVDALNGQPTFLANEDGTQQIGALGGGHGASHDNVYQSPGQGGSGGGSNTSGVDYPIFFNGRGTPGQGHDGGRAVSNGGAGGGAGGEGVEQLGGVGLNIVEALDLDLNDSQVQLFIDRFTDEGFVGGGGGGCYGAGASTQLGGGGRGYSTNPSVPDAEDGQDFCGGGGGGNFNTLGVAGGGAGMCVLVGDV